MRTLDRTDGTNAAAAPPSDDTIVALSSGALPSGVAVVRISGPAASLALKVLAGGVPEPRRASLQRIRTASGDTIDRGIALFFEGPNTVTGEDVGEIHLHGGRAVVAACLGVLVALPDVRLAVPGEFTRRAFENGRIDLTEAEGLADLLAAETEAQRAQAAAQSGGALRTLYEGWARRLVHARAMLEASFDFADEEDVGGNAAEAVQPVLRRLAGDMRAHLAGAHRGEIIRGGFRVAIAGAPNAGKSSLLNALAARDVAIVSDVPGTTRDVLEVMLDLGGLPVRLFDMAGLRETEDAVETIGIGRARSAIAAADLVVVLAEPSDGGFAQGIDVANFLPLRLSEIAQDRLPEEIESLPKRILTVRSKGDLINAADNRFGSETEFVVSAKTGEGLTDLIERIAALASEAAGNPLDALPVRTRHREIVSDVMQLLENAGASDKPPEITAETLRQASHRLGALTGAVGVEDLLDVIFSEFCIGK